MSHEKYEYIKDKYGHMSSWAIWSHQGVKSKSGMDDTSFFYNPSQTLLNTLNPNIILVGLNISERIDRVFGNFHPIRQRLKIIKHVMLSKTLYFGEHI